MRHGLFSLAVLLLLVPPRLSASPFRESLDTYCVTCHNQRLRTAGLTLDTMDLARVPAQAEIWEKVVRKLRSGTMPPAGARRPDPATYNGMASWIEAQL